MASRGARKRMAHIALRECGCVVAAVVDGAPDVEWAIAEWEDAGLGVERVTVAEARRLLLAGCSHADEDDDEPYDYHDGPLSEPSDGEAT